MTDETSYTCPSARPDSPDARVFGVVLGDVGEQRVSFLEKGVVVSAETVESLGPVAPTRVFRFAGQCASSNCVQFRDGGCRIGKDLSTKMAPATDRMPACTIRASCRWFAENGRSVCFRCSRVVTTTTEADVEMNVFSTPHGASPGDTVRY